MRLCPECGVHRFPEEVAAHGVCRPCVRKRQLVARVVLPGPRLGRPGARLSLEEVERRLRERDARLRAYNAERMRAVAARLPRQTSGQVNGAGKQETAGVATPTASTTSTARDGLSGCADDGKR